MISGFVSLMHCGNQGTLGSVCSSIQSAAATTGNRAQLQQQATEQVIEQVCCLHHHSLYNMQHLLLLLHAKCKALLRLICTKLSMAAIVLCKRTNTIRCKGCSCICWLADSAPTGTVQLNRSLPWRQPTNERRKAEQVRPIFWANRPKSYINRTSDWDKYPQGRSASAADVHTLHVLASCFL